MHVRWSATLEPNKTAITGTGSEGLGNLAKLRWTVWVKSPLARGAFDHPIGGNEHSNRIYDGIIVAKPGQGTARTAAQMQ